MDNDENVRIKKIRKTKSIKKKKSEEAEPTFVGGIKAEWSLFWHGIVGEESEVTKQRSKHDPIEFEQIQSLSIDQIKQITRMLSQDRKKLNQQIEQINRDIDLYTERLKSLELVSGNQEDTLTQINKMNDIGHQMSLQLSKVDNQLRRFRKREDELKEHLKNQIES